MRILTFLAAVATASPAWALDCVERDVTAALPADGATDQPLNAHVAVRAYGSWVEVAGLTLRTEAGELVPSSVESFPAGTDTVLVLTPDEPLEPETTYAADVTWEDGVDPSVAARFTTGDATDESAPSAPDVLDVSSSLTEDEWGEWYRLTVDMEPADDEHGVRYEVRVATQQDMSDAVTRWVFEPGESFRDDPCSTDPVAKLDADEVWVEVTAVDVAGNRSDGATGEPGEEDDSGGTTGGGSGCSTVGASGWLALVPVLMLRRRRSSR